MSCARIGAPIRLHRMANSLGMICSLILFTFLVYKIYHFQYSIIVELSLFIVRQLLPSVPHPLDPTESINVFSIAFLGQICLNRCWRCSFDQASPLCPWRKLLYLVVFKLACGLSVPAKNRLTPLFYHFQIFLRVKGRLGRWPVTGHREPRYNMYTIPFFRLFLPSIHRELKEGLKLTVWKHDISFR